MRPSSPHSHPVIAAFTTVALVALSVSGGVGLAAAWHPSNDIDPTFGTGGVASTDLPSDSEHITDMALDSDGRIVAVGRADGSYAVARYLPDGQLDPDFPPRRLSVEDQVAVQPDGKVVVGGRSENELFAVARFKADGTIDTSFGRGGRVTTRFPVLVDLQDIVVQPDGKIVAAGTAISASGGFVFARYLTDGRLDRSFGANGKVLIQLPTELPGLTEAAIQPDGKILANGWVMGSGRNRLGVVRLNEDGSRDPMFGRDGIVVLPAFIFSASGLDVQPDGSIVAGGSYSPDGFGDEFGVIRLGPDGVVDLRFGDSGIAHVDLFSLGDFTEDVAVQPNGLIVQVGWTEYEGDERNLAVLWWTPEGELYDRDEVGRFGFSSLGAALVVQPDGKAVVGGGGGPDAFTYDFGLARYLPA